MIIRNWYPLSSIRMFQNSMKAFLIGNWLPSHLYDGNRNFFQIIHKFEIERTRRTILIIVKV